MLVTIKTIHKGHPMTKCFSSSSKGLCCLLGWQFGGDIKSDRLRIRFGDRRSGRNVTLRHCGGSFPVKTWRERIVEVLEYSCAALKMFSAARAQVYTT